MWKSLNNVNRPVRGAALMALLAVSGGASAHVSEQGFVLLLPTDVYIGVGVGVVALTVALLALLPIAWSARLFHAATVTRGFRPAKPATVTSLVSLTVLTGLLSLGLFGPRDPLANLLSLTIWTLWWIGLVSLHGVFGNLWRWINPWTGLYALVRGDRPAPLRLPQRIGYWPAIVLFIAFNLFALADLAPDDPARLALVVSAYWILTFGAMLLFGGDVWLSRGECFSVVMLLYARLAPVRLHAGIIRAGIPGWSLYKDTADAKVPISLGIFSLVMLGCGSFDGLNETFWWLTRLGINPLEFPGRSAITGQTTAGLLLANVALIVMFAACVAVGVMLANRGVTPGKDMGFVRAFAVLAVSVVPIAFAYHVAHFLTAFLVNVQYSIGALTDPLNSGADFLGLGTWYVTTGFFNTQNTVRLIWLSQASVIVIGHVAAVLLAHAMAVDLFGRNRRAVVSQIPLALFMVVYTFFGLWLLASPRGA